ncbi:MAG: alanine/glycine:cation symporter family protein [Lachnospiraceae bacterium]|nr:alanine/glycine:cation symporter family protein [Lachnospiraceae bacterium]
MLQALDNAILAVTNILYQPWFVPLILVAGGLYFTFRMGFIQLRYFKEACSIMFAKPENGENISSFGAMMVSTASRVGTGNIIGVSTAICLGGPGSVFWMWITAFFGGATAFVESTLAQIYKKKNPDGSSYGGPAYYMQDALGQRWMGVVFSLLIIGIYAVGYNMLASYNLQSTFSVFGFYREDITPAVIGVILMVLFGIIILGGAKRLTKITEVMVPVMGFLYVLVAMIVILLNFRNIPSMFAGIFRSAFDLKAIFGGFSGSCIMYGVKRGLYSNEAGMGSAPNASAQADVAHPAMQGLVQMISVFVDTLVICSATALMCLSTGVLPEAELAGAGYVQASMHAALGDFGPIFIAVSLSLFAFTTLIGNYSYCEGCLEFIINRRPSKAGLLLFRLLATFLVFAGAVASAGLVWDLAEMLQGMIVVVNMPAIVLLGGNAFRCLKDYSKQRREGKKPYFHAKDIQLKEEVDFWQ